MTQGQNMRCLFTVSLNFFFKFLVFIEFVTILLLFYVFCCCFFLGHKAPGILAPRPGIEPATSVLEGEVLTTGQIGKSPHSLLESPDKMFQEYVLAHGHYLLPGHCPQNLFSLKISLPSCIQQFERRLTTQVCGLKPGWGARSPDSSGLQWTGPDRQGHRTVVQDEVIRSSHLLYIYTSRALRPLILYSNLSESR